MRLERYQIVKPALTVPISTSSVFLKTLFATAAKTLVRRLPALLSALPRLTGVARSLVVPQRCAAAS